MSARTKPLDCEQCECEEFRWNLRACALASDPPSTCECDHPAYRHRFRAESGGSLDTPGDADG